jgi:hypothetical protein
LTALHRDPLRVDVLQFARQLRESHANRTGAGHQYHPRFPTMADLLKTAITHINIVVITAEVRHQAHVAPITNGSKNIG